MFIRKPSEVEKRRRRERLWVGLVLSLVVFFGFLEGWFFKFRSDLSPLGNVLLFGLINLNVLLLLLLAYLVLRNIVKLVFERKRGLLGTKLKTRLVIAFVGLTLIPTLPLFGLATQFISFSLEYWFSHQVEQSLEQSVSLGRDYLNEERKRLATDAALMAEEMMKSKQPLIAGASQSQFQTHSETAAEGFVCNAFDVQGLRNKDFVRRLLKKYHLVGFFVADDQGKILENSWPEGGSVPDVQTLSFDKGQVTEYDGIKVVSFGAKSQSIAALLPLKNDGRSRDKSICWLGLVRTMPSGVIQKLNSVTSGYENYLQLKLLQHPFKISYFVVFSIVTLLVIFAAIWFGFFLAKSLTVPIHDMLEATEKIANGDLDVQLDWEREDEIGRLVASFNKMVHDLRESRQQLANAYEALQASHLELEQRRRYMEIVLTNIGAGVVSVDGNGTIVTMNKSAESMFGLESKDVIGQSYTGFLQSHHMDIVKSFVHMYQMSRQPNLEQQVQVMVGNRLMVLLVKISVLRDEQDQYLGVVAVFDDLSELEKAHRMAAWREVARRIAHEIKNPLTPIQLSAQRLRRKYPQLLKDESGILDECTQLIIDQVGQMKRLVNEFSSFARLPQSNPAPCRLQDMVEEVLNLYRHSYPHITFDIAVVDDEFPVLRLDRDQFKQVMVNLLDNAVHALDGDEKRIEVRLSYDAILKIARMEVADTGKGLSAEDKLRIFEPYYSTREKGTGLGLAIVASIIADHHGFVRVRDNKPRGTVIVIELPG